MDSLLILYREAAAIEIVYLVGIASVIVGYAIMLWNEDEEFPTEEDPERGLLWQEGDTYYLCGAGLLLIGMVTFFAAILTSVAYL